MLQSISHCIWIHISKTGCNSIFKRVQGRVLTEHGLKFSEVEQVMNDRFPGLTNVDVSRILRQAFSAVVTKHSTFVIGVRRRSSSTLSPFPQSSLVSTPSLSQAITHPLQLENTRLLVRVHQLEQENQHLEELNKRRLCTPIDTWTGTTTVFIWSWRVWEVFTGSTVFWT